MDAENDESSEHSEKIRDYKFAKKYDIKNDCSIDLDALNYSKNEKSENENQIEEGKMKKKQKFPFLAREEYQDKVTSFQKEEEKRRKIIEEGNKNYNFANDKDKIYKEIYNNEIEPFHINADEKIEMIQNVEIHKIDLSPTRPHPFKPEIFLTKKDMPYDTVIDSTNFWNEVPQPISAVIDRDAGTKIKIEKIKLNLPKEKIQEEKNEEEQKIMDKNKSTKIFSPKIKLNSKKKMKLMQIKKRNMPK